MLNATVGFVQEYQAGSIVDELKKTLALKATVLRAGNLTEVDAPQVVPGDILQIEEVSIAILVRGASDLRKKREPLYLQMAASSQKTPIFKSINLPSLGNLSPLTNTRAIRVMRLQQSNVESPLWSLPLSVTAPSWVVPLL